jgi:indolepyruvate ferredoxin oxidoreductase
VITPIVSSRSMRRLTGAAERLTRCAMSATVARVLAQEGEDLPVDVVELDAAHGASVRPLCMSAAAIEQAIELNGAAVAVNRAAFRWGRAFAADAAAVERALEALAPAAAAPAAASPARGKRAAAILDGTGAEGELRRLLELRVAELVVYQSAAYARRYAEEVMRVASIERERLGGDDRPVAEAYARGLYKLMAYKDEYEVARLHLDGSSARASSASSAPVRRSRSCCTRRCCGRWGRSAS